MLVISLIAMGLDHANGKVLYGHRHHYHHRHDNHDSLDDNHENHHENHHHLIGWSQVSLMVCVVTPSPLRFKGTSSGLTWPSKKWSCWRWWWWWWWRWWWRWCLPTLTATLCESLPKVSSIVRAATATEYCNNVGLLSRRMFIKNNHLDYHSNHGILQICWIIFKQYSFGDTILDSRRR